MFCKKCGAELAAGEKFCPSCGAENVSFAVPAENPTPILTWGILGVAFACSFFLSFLGIIFSAVALSKAKKYLAANGTLPTKAKVGKGLGIGGLIGGIVLTVLFIIYIAVIALAATYIVSNGLY